MTLLGTPLLIVLGFCTVLLPVATVLLWPRIHGPKAVRVTAHAGLVVASQLVAVLLVAAMANDYGYFYGTWRDLWSSVNQSIAGAPPARVTVRQVASTGFADPSRQGGITATRDRAYSSRANQAVRGEILNAHIHGPITGLSSRAHIFLPPQYFQKQYRHVSFPAVEVLTGYPGSPQQLLTRLPYQRLLLRDMHHHTARPMVLVEMRSAVVFPRDTECTDVPGGPQVQTFFAQDVPQQMSEHFRVIPNGWGASGDSTGGYCAAKITMMNPSVFHAAASLSGYFTTLHDGTTGSLWGGSRVVRNLNNLDWRLRHMPAPPVSLLVTTSRDERGPLGITNSLRFMRLARPPLQVSSIIEPHGGHVFTTWLPEIPKALSWLSARLPPPSR